MLKKEGLWLFADFVDDKKNGIWWQQLLLKTMYVFFRIACNIEAQQLINMDEFFEKEYVNLFEARFYGRFIKAIVYKRAKFIEAKERWLAMLPYRLCSRHYLSSRT